MFLNIVVPKMPGFFWFSPKTLKQCFHHLETRNWFRSPSFETRFAGVNVSCPLEETGILVHESYCGMNLP